MCQWQLHSMFQKYFYYRKSAICLLIKGFFAYLGPWTKSRVLLVDLHQSPKTISKVKGLVLFMALGSGPQKHSAQEAPMQTSPTGIWDPPGDSQGKFTLSDSLFLIWKMSVNDIYWPWDVDPCSSFHVFHQYLMRTSSLFDVGWLEQSPVPAELAPQPHLYQCIIHAWEHSWALRPTDKEKPGSKLFQPPGQVDCM